MADGGGRNDPGDICLLRGRNTAHPLSLPPTVEGRKPPRRFVLDIRGGGAEQRRSWAQDRSVTGPSMLARSVGPDHACPQPVSGGIVYIKYCVCKIRHLVLCTMTTTDGRQYLLNIFCMSTETDRLSTGMAPLDDH